MVQDEDDDDSLPNTLRAWRKFRGMSQGNLAAHLRTTKSQVSALETSDRLSISWMRRIAPILECQPSDLVETHPHDAYMKLRRAYDHATDGEREQMARVAESLINFEDRKIDRGAAD